MWLRLSLLAICKSHLTTFIPGLQKGFISSYFSFINLSLFFPHVLVFLFSESHLSGFIALSGRNLVKLTLYKVICSDVFIKMPRDIYVLRQPSIAKVFACPVCDQKTGPICTAVLYLFGLKAAEKPVTSAVFTNPGLGYVMRFPLAPHDCVLWRDWGCNITENIKWAM